MQGFISFYQDYSPEIALGSAVASLLLLLWLIVLQGRLALLHRRYAAAMETVAGVDLEGWLATQQTTQADLSARLLALEAQSTGTHERLLHHAGRVGMVRFNPFQDAGGDQSFAIAWLNEEGSGVVLSSLHSRTGVRVYAKPLARGASAHTLSVEEEEAIRRAWTD